MVPTRITGLFTVMAAVLFTTTAAGEPENEFSEIVAVEGDIKATARIRNIDNNNCSYTEKWLLGYYFWSDSRDKCPRTVIDKLEVVYKSKPVHVPAVSYNDLVNIDKVSIQPGEGSTYSVVIGTDDDDGDYDDFDIFLRFEEMVLLDRAVWRTWWENQGVLGITEYSFDEERKLYVARTPGEEYTEMPRGGQKINVSAIIRERSTGNCNDTVSANWGDWSLCPRKQVERLIVAYWGDDVRIPVSAYSDLSSVREMSVIWLGDNGMYVVHIEGGETGSSYEAFLHFEERALIRRIVWSSTKTIHAREETEYAYH